MSTDREHLADLVDAVERLAVHGHEHLRDLAARGRAHLDSTPVVDCQEREQTAARAAYAAGRNSGANP